MADSNGTDTSGHIYQTNLTNHGVIIGTSGGVLSSTATGSAGQVLQSGGASADPAYSTATYPTTATGTGTILRADGTNWVATTATYPSTTTSQQILYSTATNVVGQLTTANSKFPATNSSGTLAMRAFSINIQSFTSSGTYTPTSGMIYCIIECVGGGGGGGGTASGASTFEVCAGGGGGGGYARKASSAATIGASQTVTIGAAGSAGSAGNNAGGNGGDTSVGSICIGKGGTGGSGNNGSGPVSAGGAGGVAGTGDVTFQGQSGGAGVYNLGTAGPVLMSYGGNSYFGAGAPTDGAGLGNKTGGAGISYGGGGAGGMSYNGGGNVAGGAGVAGYITITEYIIA